MAEGLARRIAIVGGGSAGWMAAAMLGRLLDRSGEIVLVESDEIGTVGVGEATIPPIKHFNALLGLDEAAFLRETQGSFKLGIEFRDWGWAGNRYFHGFGPIGQQLGMLRCHHYWLRARAAGAAAELDRYVITAMAARAGRFTRGDPNRPQSPLSDITYAYHFDASRYAAHLRRHAEARGVRRVEGRIVDVVLDGAEGAIEAVVLADGRRIEADFFIDCSGFRALLIEGALASGWEDWSRWLPCDRALAVHSAPVGPIEPCTRSTAHGAGWCWRIPLQHRVGNGIVYSGDHLSDDEAAARLLAGLDGPALADPRPIRFRAGRRRRAWIGNCLALGLAGGFLEPLESTSLHLVQSALIRFMGLFPGRQPSAADIAEYNRQSADEYDRVRDFVILHYKASRRDDTDFWRGCRDMSVPDALTERMALFAAHGRLFRENDELFAPESWIQVLIGQGIVPAWPDPLVGLKSEAEGAAFLADIERVIARCVATMPPHDVFIASYCAAAGSRQSAAA